MSKPIVYVTRRIPEKGLGILHENCNVRMWEGDMPPPRKEIFNNLDGVEGILSLFNHQN